MKTSELLLALFQILGGVSSLALLHPFASRHSEVGFRGVYTLFALVSIGAGVALWRRSAGAWWLTLANQAFQAVGLIWRSTSVALFHGASLTVGLTYLRKVRFGDSLFTSSTGATFGSILGLPLPPADAGAPLYGVTFNLLALGLAVYAAVRLRHGSPGTATWPSASRPANA